MLRAETSVLEVPTTMPLVQPVSGVPTRTDIAFTNDKGVEKKAIRKDAEKHLQKLSSVLLRLLQKDEFVVYVAGACAPMSGVEQYTFGYFAQFVSRVTLVFTNLRILAFRVDRHGDWRSSLRVCSLSDVASAKAAGVLLTRYLQLKYANGKKESYWAMKLRDKAKLKKLMPKLLDSFAMPTPAQGMRTMCPTCYAELTENHYECNSCGQKFRNEQSLWWRSFIPGAVYFYAKQSGMGILHAIADTFITLEVILLLVGSMTLKAEQRTSDYWVGVGFFVFLLLLERSIALRHARRFVREFIPIEGTARNAQAMSAVAR